MVNGDCLDIIGKGTVKMKMHNGCARTLGDVRYVLGLKRNLISLGRFDILGYKYSARDEVIQICRCSLMMVKGKKTSCNLYKLIGETLVGKDSNGIYNNEKKVEHAYIPKKRVTFASTLIKPSGTCY